MNLAIIGCGLIGRKRALALGPDDVLVACCDVNEELAKKFAGEFMCTYFTDYRELITSVQCDAAVVSVVNKFAREIVIAFLKSGKHVLAEKPLGRNAAEAAEMLAALPLPASPGLQVPKSLPLLLLKTGFNHRFHPAIRKAKELLDAGTIGKVFNIRAAYGHGGRPGMEKEWRASKELCGGGELLDQGVHIIDLVRWFGGEVKELTGNVETKFWDLEVEDNASVIAKTDKGVTASFHVSWTNWRNIFSFEMFGTDGYLKITGLGGSYGPESLEIGKRKKEGGRPDIEVIEFPPEDISWREEWKEFKTAISEHREPIGNGYDGLMANKVIEAIYRSSIEKRVVTL
ncbi:MAG TPA: Gfo/Idh/MocA family oxidoreductase [Candidatus Kryptobacter bacterium]|nr:Gfo/Idh/MocA family oxidoreductase [Candidatus Kryptobacter bacterium]